MGRRNIIEAIKNGQFDFENSLLKRVALQVEKELSDPYLLMNEPQKKLIMHSFDFAQERMKKEAEMIRDNGGTFYRDVEAEAALFIIDNIKANCETCEKAVNMIELFVTNMMTVEEIEMILY